MRRETREGHEEEGHEEEGHKGHEEEGDEGDEEGGREGGEEEGEGGGVVMSMIRVTLAGTLQHGETIRWKRI